MSKGGRTTEKKMNRVEIYIHSLKEYRKRNGSGAVYDDPRVAVGAGRFDEVGARAEA